MKRLGSDDSLGALMSICPNSTDEHNHGNNPMYTREFQNMLEGLDEEGCVDEGGHVSEKKRRLSVNQVKALEKNFEVENKLEPERKVKLAQELGLQPRQVAVWFQNRRARWKTKQLERDYGVLKANYDDLKLKFESLQRDNESLLKEINELKSKMDEDVKTESNKLYVKEEGMVSDSEEKGNLESENLSKSDEAAAAAATDDHHHQLNFESFNGNNHTSNGEASAFGDFKDGSSDSDSSAILNEDNNNSPNDQPFLENNFHSGSAACTISFQLSDFSKPSGGGAIGGEDDPNKGGGVYQPSPQYVKIEEHNFFGEECCSTNFFSDDQAPTLHWYCSDDQWN